MHLYASFRDYTNIFGRKFMTIYRLPSMGILHFYMYGKTSLKLMMMCQFPSTGIFHFYLTTEYCTSLALEKRVNSLIRVSFISAHNLKQEEILCLHCVNSLIRVSCISTFWSKITLSSNIVVSIPLYGYLAFLRYPLRTL